MSKIKGKQIANATIAQANIGITTDTVVNSTSITTKEYVDNLIINEVGNLNYAINFNHDALATVEGGSQYQLASNTSLLFTPKSVVKVLVNGIEVNVGSDCVFSPDGTTVREIGQEQQGDFLYWNTTTAPFQLETSDEIDFIYLIRNSTTVASYFALFTPTTGNETINLSIYGTGSITIYWGDGNSNIYNFDNGDGGGISYTYSTLDKQYQIYIENGGNLTTLNLYNLNISSIDLSTNTNLSYLDLNTLNISSIDLSTNTNLSELTLYTLNSLSSIDLSTNTNLSYLYLFNLNNLSSIDLSTNTNLSTLILSFLNISSIDLSTNTNLSTVNLQYLNISSIDLSTNSKLNSIFLQNNKFTSDDVNAILAACVAFNTNNKVLYLNNQSSLAPPTGQGLIDKATLISRGWTVQTD